MNTRASIAGALSMVAFTLLSNAQEQAARVPNEGLSISARRGRLTMHVDKAPLPAVLDELSRQTRITVTIGEGLDLEVVSAEVNNVAIEDGVRQLLARYDSFLYYTPDRRGQSALSAVWVYPKGTAATLRPVSADAWASAGDLDAARNDRDPAVRERAYDALMSRPDRHSQNLVALAIQGASETDTGLRERLLSSAISRGVLLPREMLADLVRADAAESIRLMALEALSGDPASRDVGVAALNDASELVRERAKDFLAELDIMARRDGIIR